MSAGRSTLEIVRGDIAAETSDAIVNAANSSLLGGGGVDGAIHRAAGPQLLQECIALGGCKVGDAKVTTAGALSARVVVHAVGPVWNGGSGNEAELLGRCHRRSVELADSLGLLSISFPALSCGAYGYPPERAAPVAIQSAWQAASDSAGIGQLRFVLFSESLRNAFAQAATQLGLTIL
jgi:O-acetyl-ADP-ribose deacetylase